ncbi:hypothetical protein AURDEDRAFT_168927 [Auricularia subglabra TFB-10046 SS5]|nr:hypothetical protein AURDEDRAFT_168927 [Auricularia subglabra TFB-10046 SS5]
MVWEDGSIVYACVLGRHGHVASIVNGIFQHVAPAPIGPLPPRDNCSSTHCEEKRDSACANYRCRVHCIIDRVFCGYADHDVHKGSSYSAQEDLTALWLNPEAIIRIHFVDRDFISEANVVCNENVISLQAQPAAVQDALHLNEVRMGSLECQSISGTWIPSTALLPVGNGTINLRARTIPNISSFPLALFRDMYPRLLQFPYLVAKWPSLTTEAAFSSLFGIDPKPLDLEAFRLCLNLIRRSPRNVLMEFQDAGHSPSATWSGFTHRALEAFSGLVSTKDEALWNELRTSPLLHASRRASGTYAVWSGIAFESKEHIYMLLGQ